MKKIGLISLALVLALGLGGVGYATWADVLTITGTVNTGTVSAVLSTGACSDDEVKDVSSISCVLTDPKTLTVTVTNAYPSITYTCEFDVHNTGTVPVILKPVVINLAGVPAGATITVLKDDGNPLEGTQIEQFGGDPDTIYGKITVHINNTVDQGGSFSFSVTIDATQYNEA